MSCINKSHSDYTALKSYFGASVADSLIRNNKMIIPTIEEANKIIKGNKVLQFKKTLNYLRNTVSSSIDDLLNAMPHIIQRKGEAIYVNKGTRISEKPTPGAKEQIETPNVSFLNAVNEQFGEIFNMKAYNLSFNTGDIRDEVLSRFNELNKENKIPEEYIQQYNVDPSVFFQYLVDNILTDYTETADRLGDEMAKMISDYNYKTTIVNRLQPFENVAEPGMWGKTTPVEFAASVLPKEYIEQYKNLYELTSQLQISINVNRKSVAERALASYQSQTVHLSPYTARYSMNNWDDFVETFNHELIHGLMARTDNEYEIHKELKPLFDKAMEYYHEANEEVKNTLVYIKETIKEYRHIVDFKVEGPSKPKTPNLEEFITFAFTSPEFVKFLNTIPYSETVETDTKKTIWTELKKIIEKIIKAISPNSLLNKVTEILNNHFDISFQLSNMNDRRRQYNWPGVIRFVDLNKQANQENEIKNQTLSKYRDNTKYAFSDLKYPDTIFRRTTTENEAKIAVNFYKKIVDKFNKDFNRNVRVQSTIDKTGKFSVVVEYESGVKPTYFAYPTGKLGDHSVVNSLNNDVPLTSLRHELIHEMLVKNILEKFERVNLEDKSATTKSLDDVQRDRAYNYTLEDVFFERVVENIERNPDYKDTFPIETYGMDVTNRLNKELNGEKPSFDTVNKVLDNLLKNANPWLKENLKQVFSKLDYSKVNNITEVSNEIGKSFKQRFDLAKNIFSDSLQRKIFDFTKTFNEEYQGLLTRLDKQIKPQPGKRLFNQSNPQTGTISAIYKANNNITVGSGENIYSLDTERSKQIADAYESMKHDPNDPVVKEAYENLAKQTLSQFEAIQKEGYTIELYQGDGEPYANSDEMIKDVRENKHQYVLSTENDFGQTTITDEQREDNPLLQDSGFKDVNGKLLLVNDVFRYVHDFFGHTERGNSFGPLGEENAWDVHSRMFTGSAVRAMTTETRGQNSWVNFGSHVREENGSIKKISLAERIYAEQKMGLLPIEFSTIKEDNNVKNKVDTKISKDQNTVTSAILNNERLFNNLTEDEYGNYVFFHYSTSDLSKKTIDPKKFGENVSKTSKEERSRTVPVSMYYTRTDQGEPGFGDFKHIVRVSQGQVYPFNDDPLKLVEEAEKRFRKEFGDRAFTPNEQIGWVGKVAAEKGYVMVVGEWNIGKTKAFRAETTKALKPELIQRPPQEGFYGSGTVETLTAEKFSSNKKRYKSKVKEGIADDTKLVDIDETKLSELVDENKKSVKKSTIDNTIPNEERYQKGSIEEWYADNEQIKRFTVGNIVNLLSTKFNISFEYDYEMDFAARFSKGKIYLNPNKIGLDSPFHEIAHPFIELIKSENSELYNNLINELKNTEEGKIEIERIAKDYPELTPQEQLDEALVSFIGKNAADLYKGEETPKKSLLCKFWDWIKEVLFGMSVQAKDFDPTMSLRSFSELLVNPMFSIDLSRQTGLTSKDEYYQKKSSQQLQRDFDALIDDTLAKLKADVNISGRTESEKKRKFFSSKQVEQLQQDKKDINALNSFVTSGLFNLKDVNDRFDEFIKLYEGKKNKTKEDIRNLSLLLNEIEDNITLYSNVGPLLESIFEQFPEESDNISDWAYSLKREKRLLNEYQSWGLNVVADWLLPFYDKAVRKALATNTLNKVVSQEVYENEAKVAAEEGITDQKTILNRAIKQEIRNTLLIAKKDASGITGYLAGVLNSRDSIASTVGQSIMDELHKALVYGKDVEQRFRMLMKKFRGSSLFSSNADEKKFYSGYVRKAKVWTYLGLDKDGQPKYEYRDHTAFHEEFEWDTFYNTKREDFEKILKPFGGKIPTKTDLVNYKRYKDARDMWFKNNTATIPVNGKQEVVPSSKYKNVEFPVLMNDPLFKDLYTTYKNSNLKLGAQGLKYGIVPQVKTSAINVKGIKFKNSLEAVRNWIGEQEQVYFAQSIAGGERPIIPISFVKLLEEDDLSYNFINSVSKFVMASSKYESMRMIEPQVQILKNFIGGNSALNIKKRRTIKRSASGIKAMSKIIHDELYTESKKLNNQLTSFLNDAVYGQSMKKEVIQIWDSKFQVWKTKDTSNNGGPKVEVLHGFENVIQFTQLHDLDYSGFEFNKPREVGEYTIKMIKKDWNFSVKKTADRLGLLTALETMIINPISASVNVIRGKTESFVESLGGRYFTIKDFVFGEGEYWKALGSGAFMEDLKGEKPSFLSSMLIKYDAIQGELIDAFGRKLESGLANKFFRTRRLFFLQNGGEHYIQTQLMAAMMNHQKIRTNSGETLSLYEARKREYEGKLKFSDVEWTEDQDREFKETLAEVNTRLNGNYNKVDKAMIQRTWWGSALMMFRKHIYNGLANRYRKGYVNYQTGDYTEGYWRTFFNGLIDEIGEMVRDRQIRKFNLNEQEKYAFRKFGGDLFMVMAFITMFKMFDDDDDENEFNDSLAIVFRRLVSEMGQYTPIIAPLEAGKMVKNPSAISYTVSNFYEAFKQVLVDPTEVYEREGPGYKEGENKAWKKWQRVIPGWRIVLNTQEPERLLKFYQQNSLGFLKPSAGKGEEEELGNE